MAKANQKNCTTIKRILESFSHYSSQKVNHLKSKVIFSRNCSSRDKISLSTILNIHAREDFGKYLGFPIFPRKPCNRDFQFIVYNLNNKMVGWKIKFLNMAGRATLAKSYLNIIPTHVMQYISIPSKILKTIDKTQRNFIWGSISEK